MTVILAFLALVALAAGLWLSQQRLASKPWLETGIAPLAGHGPGRAPGFIFIAVFLAVAGGLFAMLGSAFVMQIDETPWELVPLPGRVWFNTALLLLASLFMQFVVISARAGTTRWLRASLIAASIATLAFLAGQVQVWIALTSDGYPLDGPPAASFFYLITGLHGLHVLGGIIALAVICLRHARGGDVKALLPGVRLCALYWHGLLAFWLMLFALLQGWGNAFLALCRAAVT
ncbi:cytochrome c oxidase subunit 3 [Leisingera aquaemixtae]|uniref:Cytochrome c oxidase subunit 3 n=1 Tax=Leisingera aquaemixtae TaxID=1396826 RepID=A0ABY5WLL7_9RHOB|nr:cytochrome c oxidase subunit 3 [Leisingera aquaemixtae]UWQ42354.1 cytochrome c oxidase subunit 3 [Leisingera aquaemixtae]